MAGSTSIKLKVPTQDLQAFTHFPLELPAAREWARGLPVTNTQAVAQQLRHVLSDLSRSPLAPEKRFAILETLLPKLEVALSNLARRYLNQPLVIPEEPRQMAETADSLCGLTSTAYTVVAIEAIRGRDAIRDTNPARLACEAIRRAVVFGGRQLLQTFQLYRPVPLHGWLTLHQLYALAEAQGLEALPVEDDDGGANTVRGAYLQALIMGCCKPNQLRQSDLAGIYRGLREWSSLVTLETPPATSGIFLVNLDSDQPPVYSSLYREARGSECRIINTDALRKHLAELRAGEGRKGVIFDKDTRLPPNMLDHMERSLGSASLRNFKRSDSQQKLWVSIGLSAAHYHLAGERSFEQLLFGDEYVPPVTDRVATNPFLAHRETGDLWQQANPEEDFEREETQRQDAGEEAVEHQVELDDATMAELLDQEDAELAPEERYPAFEVQMVNASPGGYCLEWSDELPGDTRTGDIVSVREEAGKDWSIAVIRWISQLESTRTLLGLELLSPRAKPYGALIRRKTGDKAAPMRVLLLPEVKLVGQPHTLITPRAGFVEGQKISLVREGEDYYVQLQRLINTTGSFAQFDFRYIKQIGEVLEEDAHGSHASAYDSLWSKI
jgi:hypothetical protein